MLVEFKAYLKNLCSYNNMYQRNYAPSTSFNNPQAKPFQIITIAEDAHSKIKN